MKEIRISVEEFAAAIGHSLTVSCEQTVFITQDGQEELVLLSERKYARLLQTQDPVSIPIEALRKEDLDRLEQSPISEKSRQIDHLLPKDW